MLHKVAEEHSWHTAHPSAAEPPSESRMSACVCILPISRSCGIPAGLIADEHASQTWATWLIATDLSRLPTMRRTSHCAGLTDLTA